MKKVFTIEILEKVTGRRVAGELALQHEKDKSVRYDAFTCLFETLKRYYIVYDKCSEKAAEDFAWNFFQDLDISIKDIDWLMEEEDIVYLKEKLSVLFPNSNNSKIQRTSVEPFEEELIEYKTLPRIERPNKTKKTVPVNNNIRNMKIKASLENVLHRVRFTFVDGSVKCITVKTEKEFIELYFKMKTKGELKEMILLLEDPNARDEEISTKDMIENAQLIIL